MSTIYTSSQIRTIPNVIVAKNSNILEDATVGNNLMVGNDLSVTGDISGANLKLNDSLTSPNGEIDTLTSVTLTASVIKLLNHPEDKEEDLEKRLQAIEENLADEDLHTTTEEAKQLVKYIKEGTITVNGTEYVLSTSSLKDFHAKINGTEDTEESLLTSNLKTNLEENIKETNKNTIDVLSAVDTALGGRITALEGQINGVQGVNGDETYPSTLKTEINTRIDNEVETLNNTIGDCESDDSNTVYGKINAINNTLNDRITDEVKTLNETITKTESDLTSAYEKADADITSDYKAADVALKTEINTRINNVVETINETITKTESDLTSAYEDADAELNGRITALEGQINGVDGAETNTSKLKTEIKETIGECESDDSSTVYGKINNNFNTLDERITNAVNTLNETIDGNKNELTSAYKAADVALSNRIEANEDKLGGIDITVKDAIEYAKNEAIDHTDKTIGKYNAEDGDTTVYGKMYALNERIKANEGKLGGITETVISAIDAAKKELKDYTDTAKTDAISTADTNATVKATEARDAAKEYTNTMIGDVTSAYKAADTILDTKIEELESTVGQEAITGENGEVIHDATGIFKVIVDYKTSIDNLTAVVKSYKDHVDTYTDTYINGLADDRISELVGTESTDESSATGLFEKVANNKTEIDVINEEIITLQTALGSSSDKTNTETAFERIEANESAISNNTSSISDIENTLGSSFDKTNTKTAFARIEANESAINAIKSVIGTEETTEGTIHERIEANESAISANSSSISDIQTALGSSSDKTNTETAFARIEANESAISNNTSSISVIKTAIGTESTAESPATGIYAKIDANESAISNNTSSISDIETTIGHKSNGEDAATGLFEKIENLQTALGTSDGTNDKTAFERIKELENTLNADKCSEVTVTDDESDTKSKSFTVLKGAMYAILSSLTSTVKLGDKQIGTAQAQEQRCLMATENGTFTIATDADDTTDWEVEVYQTN